MTTSTSEGGAGSGPVCGAVTGPLLASIAVIGTVPVLFVLIALDGSGLAVAAVLAVGGLADYYLRRTRLGRIRP